MIRMRLDDIAVSGEGKQFLVLLRPEDEGDARVLPIVIDAMQALAIAAGRNGETPPRPLTHDLVLSLIEVMGATVAQIEITDLQDGTFFAVLAVERSGVRYDVDARPSDALAIAVRASAPILVAEKVLEASALQDDTDHEGAVEA
jgi:bifunctional DNase/RNase